MRCLKLHFTKLQIAVHALAWLPLLVLIWDALNNNLTVNPIQEITFRTGKTALIILTLSLAVTPLHTLTGWNALVRVRRALGLYAFMYAVLHFLTFSGLDYGFALDLIVAEISEKPYIIVGTLALLVLVLLALTSTRGWQHRLKKNWKRLHRLVYAASLLVIVHYIWVVKNHQGEPWAWGAVVVFLLAMRLSFVKRTVVNWRMQLRQRRLTKRTARQTLQTQPRDA
jgi:sulfoxide reductase heme-binding subunit YedZ